MISTKARNAIEKAVTTAADAGYTVERGTDASGLEWVEVEGMCGDDRMFIHVDGSEWAAAIVEGGALRFVSLSSLTRALEARSI